MEIKWKVVGVFGGIGFIISLLVGAISGVGFGTVILRGIVSGAIFGGIGFGLTILIKNYLPGLASEDGETETDDELETENGGIDIVIEEELPSPSMDTGDMTPEEAGDEEESAESAFVEEVEERSEGDLEAADEAEEVEELEEADSEEEPELVTLGEGSDVDSLPDIGEFSGSFATGGDYENDEDNADEQASAVEYTGGGNSPIEVLGQEESPANVAKAVQTMLKRE